MNNFQIIPAIDILDWKCVRLIQWDFDKKTEYNITPLETAKAFEKSWIKKIHLVDLDWARSEEIVNLDILCEIIDGTNLNVEFWWGIREKSDIYALIKTWVHEINIWSLAINSPDTLKEFISEFWSDKFTIWVDVFKWEVKISWWKKETWLQINDYLEKLVEMRVRKINITDIEHDWMLKSPNFTFYEDLVKKYPSLNIVASWWISSIEDIQRIKEIWCTWAIIWKAIYEWKITLEQLKML